MEDTVLIETHHDGINLVAEAALALQALHYASTHDSSGSSTDEYDDTTHSINHSCNNTNNFDSPQNQVPAAICKEGILLEETALEFPEPDQQSDTSESQSDFFVCLWLYRFCNMCLTKF